VLCDFAGQANQHAVWDPLTERLIARIVEAGEGPPAMLPVPPRTACQ
jgi:hypothetical protein